jgi:acyl-CoA thioester hydrolase
MAAEIFTLPLTIAAADIDELGHVNNIVYLRWAQELAIAHWRARASAEMIAANVWVVLRHEVDYRSALLPGDQVEARTWVDDAPRGASWPRFVQIAKLGAPRPAAEIKSNWCLLDAGTRRVKRVPAEMTRLFVR